MTRSANPRRFVARTAVAAATALLAVACSNDPGASSSISSAPVTPARLSHALPDDPARMALPATGPESRWTQGLDVLARQVARTVETSCARRGGISQAEQPPVSFISYSEIPDLDFLARHGFGHGAEVPTPTVSPAPPRSGGPATIDECRAQGSAAAKKLRDTYAPLQGRWFRELAAVQRLPATVRALDTLPGCLSGYGFEVRDENGFFGLVDSRLLDATSAEFPYVDRELGRAYATCMRPVEAVREPARLRLRARFLAEHAEEVSELRTTLLPALRQAEKEFGVRLSFPAP